MSLLNQPHDVELGDEIQDHLAAGEFDTFYIMTAYAKQSGVSRIKPYLQKFHDSGGTIKAIIGIDQKSTSRQALEELLPVCDELYTYHSESLTQTFHPKAYSLEMDEESSILYVGSNNLTAGGLFTNYELSTKRNYDFSNESDYSEYQDFISIFDRYSDTDSEMCRKLDSEEIENLYQDGYVADEDSSTNQLSERAAKVDKNSSLFGSENFEPPSIEVDSPEEGEIPEPKVSDEGFWKGLSKNDVKEDSSGGQIIIPRKFEDYLPAVTDWETKPSGGSQADVYFDVIFIDSDGDTRLINGARLVHYAPAPDHARDDDDIDIRFTFRDRDILEMLEENDVLEFRQTDNSDVEFTIQLVKPSSEEYDNYDISGYRDYDFI